MLWKARVAAVRRPMDGEAALREACEEKIRDDAANVAPKVQPGRAREGRGRSTGTRGVG